MSLFLLSLIIISYEILENRKQNNPPHLIASAVTHPVLLLSQSGQISGGIIIFLLHIHHSTDSHQSKQG